MVQGLLRDNRLDFLTGREFALPALFVLGGFVLGFALERLIIMALGRLWSRRGWDGWQTVRKSLLGMVTLLFVAGGLYSAMRVTSLAPTVLSVYQKAFVVLVIFTLSLVTARIAAGLVDLSIRKAEGALPSTTIWGNVVRMLVVLTGFLVALKVLDVPITPILTALGVGGFAMALAFQDTLSNLFAGLHILASKQLGPGDYVRLDSGDEGYVVDVTWRNTTIRTLPNNVVVIPNSRLASAIITNFHRPAPEVSVLVDVGVSYDSDLRRVEEVTLEVARQVLSEEQGGVSDFEPMVFFRGFSDFRIEFTVVLRARQYVDRFRLKHEFIKRLHERYREVGIEIPSATRALRFEPERV
ncbi:MAG: mechanosensitive ion channel family protein [Actinobacteria bacterium]|nr:mechanosensitive ion channel family protein [Actinomycetota bacterium]